MLNHSQELDFSLDKILNNEFHPCHILFLYSFAQLFFIFKIDFHKFNIMQGKTCQ